MKIPENKIAWLLMAGFIGFVLSLPNTGVDLVVATTTATCDSTNITCLAQPLLQLMDFMPLVIAKVPNIIIPLVIVMVLAGAVIAIGAIPLAIVGLIVALTKSMSGRFHFGSGKL